MSSSDALQSKGSTVADSNESDITPVISPEPTSNPYNEDHEDNSNVFTKFVDSFKAVELSPEVEEELKNPLLTDDEKRTIRLKNTPLTRTLKSRHIQMIAIGGSIGTGLFVGAGSALRTGGAASLPICWSIVGLLMFCTIHALGELATAYPISGAFSAHATKFIEPSFGFAVGWNYAILWLLILPTEIIAASMTIQYWNDSITPVAWVSIFYVFIMSINMFGVRAFGEAEYVFSMIKLLTIVGFLILGVVLVCGGGPSHGFIGGENYRNPGPFTHGFKGVCTVFVTACYSLGGTELVGITGAESTNPRKHLPKAIKQVFWRIILFFLGSLTLISLLVNANDKRLLGSYSSDAKASPFVIAIRNGGIKGLPHVMNAVILVSVLSVGNSCVYGCSRTLASLAAQGLAPKCFNYVDRMGRPIVGMAANAVIGLLCYCVASKNQGTVFAWLMSLCGVSAILIWSSICLSHIRFRLAMKVQGRSTSELAFASHAGIYGSVFTLLMYVLVLSVQFWISLFPLGGSGADVTSFFQNYLGGVLVLVFIIGRKLWVRKFWEMTPLKDIDLDDGRSTVDIDLMQQEIREEKEMLRTRNFFYRTYRFWC